MHLVLHRPQRFARNCSGSSALLEGVAARTAQCVPTACRHKASDCATLLLSLQHELQLPAPREQQVTRDALIVDGRVVGDLRGGKSSSHDGRRADHRVGGVLSFAARSSKFYPRSTPGSCF